MKPPLHIEINERSNEESLVDSEGEVIHCNMEYYPTPIFYEDMKQIMEAVNQVAKLKEKEMTDETERQTAKLDLWNLFGEVPNAKLIGTVYDHPRIPDGSPVHTSLVHSFDREAKIAKTKNTDYTLLEERV